MKCEVELSQSENFRKKLKKSIMRTIDVLFSKPHMVKMIICNKHLNKLYFFAEKVIHNHNGNSLSPTISLTYS